MFNLSHDDNESNESNNESNESNNESNTRAVIESKERIRSIMGCVSIADRRTLVSI